MNSMRNNAKNVKAVIQGTKKCYSKKCESLFLQDIKLRMLQGMRVLVKVECLVVDVWAICGAG